MELSTSEAEAWQWQERLSRFAREVLPLQLERLFDRVTPSGELMKLDSVEIEVSFAPSEGAWEERLATEIIRKIGEAMPSGASGSAAGVSSGNAQTGTPGANPLDAQPGASTPGSPQVSGTEQSVMEQFFYFLETGRLPWQATEVLRRSLEKAVLSVLKKEEMRSAWREKFLDLLNRAEVGRRLGWQFSPKTLAVLAQHFFPERQAEVAENLRQIEWVVTQTAANPERLTAIFWAAFFEKPTAGVQLLPTVIQRFLEESPRKNKVFQQAAKTDEGIFLKKILEALPTRQEETQMGEAKKVSIDQLEGLYLENAGLVLLHPFLPTFFEALGMAKAGELTQPHRAALLLLYLATNRTVAPEHLLPLNKLLCGLPLDEPVPGRIRLTKKEKTEAQNLLEAVINHWVVLKNTSTENLQGSFLCREGKLTLQADGEWRLRVEQKTWDVLLDSLPWGISVIRLPWMKEMLNVEWA